MNKSEEIKEILVEYPQYQEALFVRGYLITNDDFSNLNSYPFYGYWNHSELGKLEDGNVLNIYYHSKQDFFIYKEGDIIAAIIGHAYNPFDMKYDEVEILKDCIAEFKKGRKAFFEKVSELTGIHLIVLNDRGKLIVLQDCAGMKACYYGLIQNRLCITSHPQLAADIYNLQMDRNIEELIRKRFFSLTGRYLPGDLSPYKELRRLGPNTFIHYNSKFELKRFYPTKEHPEINLDQYKETTRQIADLINRNIRLCAQKWERPAISLSGGIDSRTTLACANGLYDKFKYYSFHSKPQEVQDANAAHRICEEIGLKHEIYAIPENNTDIDDFEILKKIIFHNSSYIDAPRDHEIRKFIYLYRLNDFDVELKSWISEIGRAMLEKKVGVKLPKNLTPRHFSIFQTRYFGSMKLLKHADYHYKDYLKRINLEQPLYNYEHPDFFYWEFRWGSWGSNVVTVQNIFNHTVTMPLNNRKLIDMFLWFPHDYRKQNMVNKEIIRHSNEQLANLDISVANNYLRWNRICIEKLYYYYRTCFYKS